MHRRQFLLAGGTGAVGVLAGCITSAQEQDPVRSTDQESTITVRTSGEVTASPDMAVLDVGIESIGDDPRVIRDDLADRSARIRGELLDFGIHEDRIITTQFNVREIRHQREPGGDDRRYEGIHGLSIEITEIESVGEIIDLVIDAGVDSVRRIHFTISDEERKEHRDESLRLAIENARGEADMIANEVDATVVGIKSVNTVGGHVRGVSREVMVAYDAAPATDLHPGDVTVSAEVQIEFYIKS